MNETRRDAMISRVADHCFWLGRYLERAESAARLLFVVDNLALDAALPPDEIWPPVVIVAGERDRFVESRGPGRWVDANEVLDYLTWDVACPVSILRSVGAARDNARATRETVSLEVWQTVNELWVWLSGDDAREQFEANRYEVYKRITRDVTRIAGELDHTMLRAPAFDFIRLGAMLERAAQTARVLDVYYHALHRRSQDLSLDAVLLPGLLRACAALEPFIKRHPGKMSKPRVAAFLFGEPRLPRSVRFSIDKACSRFEGIRPDPSLPGGETADRLFALRDWIAAQQLRDADVGAMHEMLTHVVDETGRIGNVLGRELLGH